MTHEDEKIIEDVKFVLASGNESVIKALRATIPAYLHCIAIDRDYEAAMAKKELLLKKQRELLEKKKEFVALKRKTARLEKKKKELISTTQIS